MPGKCYEVAVRRLFVVLAVGLAACGSTGGSQTPVNLPVAASVSPTPPAKAFTEVTLTGQGSRVTDQFELPTGNYKVTWSGTVGQYGGNIIAYMVGNEKTLLMATTDMSGSTLFQSGGGFFFIQVDATGVTWKITIDAI